MQSEIGRFWALSSSPDLLQSIVYWDTTGKEKWKVKVPQNPQPPIIRKQWGKDEHLATNQRHKPNCAKNQGKEQKEGNMIGLESHHDSSGAKGILKIFSKIWKPRSRDSVQSFQIHLRYRRQGQIKCKHHEKSETPSNMHSNSSGIP